MKTWLYNYDIYPRVFPCGQKIRITIRPLGRQAAFFSDREYHVEILDLLYRKMVLVREDPDCLRQVPVTLTEDGCLTFTAAFEREQEHFIYLYEGDKLRDKLSVYSLEQDLAERIPLMGDLHVHSIFSDGRQAPEIVAADYRRRGYDFMTLTDHHNYAGSLAAIHAYQGLNIDLNIVPGEEVHLPGNDVHIVNFGGRHSINFEVESDFRHLRENGIDPDTEKDENWRALPGEPVAAPISVTEYRRQVEEIEKEFDLPENFDRFAFAACVWICRRIREAGGLSIFAHPYWIRYAYHLPEEMTERLYADCPFDAFEVLGGERYLEQNEFQTWLYVCQSMKGHLLPVVGNSDSHNMFNNPDLALAATIVFANRNERTDLIESIRGGWCVAVDLISQEKRLVGDLRLVRYARFLLEYYFPVHDELCVEEGRLMRDYICGTREESQDAVELLNRLHGRTDRLRKRLLKVGKT